MFSLQIFKDRDPVFKENVWLFFIAYFLVLFNYPMVRASSTAIFFEIFSAKSSPLAWLGSISFLCISVYLCNLIQSRNAVQRVFLLASAVSALVFFASCVGYYQGSKILTYLSFIWKEIYIVIQVHLLLAYANTYFSKEDFKVLVGPIGAVGSLGGILGGLATTFISSRWGTLPVLWIAILFILVPAGIFYLTSTIHTGAVDRSKSSSPLESINLKGVREYVAYIAVIIMMTQFIISIIDFRFNLIFEAEIASTSARTSYLGEVYTWTNLLTLVLQLFLLPVILPKVRAKNLHLFIPLSYLCLIVGIMLLSPVMGLAGIAFIYVYLKASDYSLFSAAKEMLYLPLLPEQKYGAKYLTDMIVYRASKALIAALLIYVQSSFILNIMMILFIVVWVGLVLGLFKVRQRLFN